MRLTSLGLRTISVASSPDRPRPTSRVATAATALDRRSLARSASSFSGNPIARSLSAASVISAVSRERSASATFRSANMPLDSMLDRTTAPWVHSISVGCGPMATATARVLMQSCAR